MNRDSKSPKMIANKVLLEVCYYISLIPILLTKKDFYGIVGGKIL